MGEVWCMEGFYTLFVIKKNSTELYGFFYIVFLSQLFKNG